MTQPLRVLIIEDVEDDAILLTLALRHVADELITRRVQTPDELRDALASGDWDIVLSDYALPTFDGITAFRMVRESNEDLPFVLVSGTIGEERAVDAVRAGIDDYVVKDNLERLGVAVERAMREAEQRRQHRVLERRFEHAQRLESLGKLAGTVAHDFNNVVMVVESYGHLVLEQLADDHPARSDVKVMQDAARRASDLTRQLLAFSRRQTMQIRRMDLNEVLRGVEPLLNRLLGEDVSLHLRYDDGLGVVEVDPGQLEQIVMNLAVNARDAMPEGGKLTLSTERVTLDGEVWASLRVIDTGHGMDEETRNQIFEPFFTTKSEEGGTGLGLSTVYGIIKQSGGEVKVDSSPGQGTTFTLLLPLAQRDTPSSDKPEARPLGDAAPSHTVLLVEDDPQLRRGIRRILQGQGHRVIEAADGSEAIAKAEEHQDAIGLLVTDLVMPNMGGRELIARLSAERPELRVVLMSGYTDRMGPKGLIPEDVPFIAKPFSPDQLLDKIREALAG